ncbi:hypothetical protein NE237_009589 [Protea cynaroides]|uniref:Uncharacterized protein n=1 Tax=Protea cynaroides TaxID=273540 RepID=A0A9Q0R0S9_9MAGN|nr:hypothetical protein NE237_009589 [Protea cynaroides]
MMDVLMKAVQDPIEGATKSTKESKNVKMTAKVLEDAPTSSDAVKACHEALRIADTFVIFAANTAKDAIFIKETLQAYLVSLAPPPPPPAWELGQWRFYPPAWELGWRRFIPPAWELETVENNEGITSDDKYKFISASPLLLF